MKSLELENMNGLMEVIMKDKLIMDWDMGKVLTLILRKEWFMKEIGKMDWDMEREYLSIEMDLYMKVIGKEEWSGGRVRWPTLLETILKETGLTIKEMEKE